MYNSEWISSGTIAHTKTYVAAKFEKKYLIHSIQITFDSKFIASGILEFGRKQAFSFFFSAKTVPSHDLNFQQ